MHIQRETEVFAVGLFIEIEREVFSISLNVCKYM